MSITPSHSGSTPTAWSAIRLVASREIRTRMRSKAFIWTSILGVVGVIAMSVIAGIASGSSSELRVGLVPSTQSLATAIEVTGHATETEMTTTRVSDRTAGERMVSDEDLDALIVGTPDDFDVVVDSEVDPALRSALTAVAQQVALGTQVSALGGDPAEVARQVGAAVPTFIPITQSPERDFSQAIVGYVVGILLFVSIMTTGQLVAQGVVEEKSSRIVELLLAVLRPWQLMAGKVLGIGMVGLSQMALFVAVGSGSALARGLIEPEGLNLGTTALWALAWFTVGYVMYAVVYAALGALVSRQEEIGSVTAPVLVVMMIPYIVGVSIAPWNPDSPLVVGLSYVPFCSTFLMPIRIALGAVGAAESLLVFVGNLALIPVLVWLSGRIYTGAVLRTGSRVKISQALRSTP